MFSEAVKTFKSIKPLFLLATFFTFSLIAYNNSEFSLLEQPFSWWAFLIPVISVGGFLFAIIWVEVLHWIKVSMEDTFPIIPCALLMYAVLITFWFLANNPNGLNTALLVKPDFIYTCTLYIATLVAFEVAKPDELAKYKYNDNV